MPSPSPALVFAHQPSIDHPDVRYTGGDQEARAARRVREMRLGPLASSALLLCDQGLAAKPRVILAARRLGCLPLADPIQGLCLALGPTTAPHAWPLGVPRARPRGSRHAGPRLTPGCPGLPAPGLAFPRGHHARGGAAHRAPPASLRVACSIVPSPSPSPRTTPRLPAGRHARIRATTARGSASGQGPWGPCRTRHAQGRARPLESTGSSSATPPRPTPRPSSTPTRVSTAQGANTLSAEGPPSTSATRRALASQRAKRWTRLAGLRPWGTGAAPGGRWGRLLATMPLRTAASGAKGRASRPGGSPGDPCRHTNSLFEY